MAALALAAVLATGATSCGDGQDPWCAELESLGDLGELSAAIASGDGPSARGQLDRFRQVASDAPDEIREEMAEIADVLDAAAEVSLAGSDAEELEARREATNQRLARIPARVSEVTSWAEEECGIRLD